MSKKHSTSGARPNEIVFPSPLYISHWLNDTFFIVGGGGGETKFGMSNFIVLFEVVTSDTPDGDSWKQRAALDFGEKVIWCTSEVRTVENNTESPTNDGKQEATSSSNVTYQFAVSSKDCCYLVECKLDPVSLTKSVEVALDFDAVNGDKKPIGTTADLVFAAQDDNSVAVLIGDRMMKEKEEGGKSPRLAELKQWDETPLWRGRIRTILVKAISSDQVLLVTGSEDKRVHCLLLSTAGNTKIEIQQVVVVTEQHLKLPFALMQSSFRTMHWDTVRGPTALVLNVFNPRTADSHLIQVEDIVQSVEGSKSAKKVVFNDCHRLVVPKDGVSDLSLQPFSALAGTVEGKMIEVHRAVGGNFTTIGQSRELHGIPISSVCLNAAGGIISTDIGQRVNITRLEHCNLTSHLPCLSHLPPVFVRPSWHKKMALFILMVLFSGLMLLVV